MIRAHMPVLENKETLSTNGANEESGKDLQCSNDNDVSGNY